MRDRFEIEQASATDSGAREAKKFVSDLIAGLPEEQSFDARGLLDQHPELQQYKSVVLDLAYEQYFRQDEAGRDVDPVRFAQQFSGCQHSLLRLIDAHGAFKDLEFFDDATVRWPQPGDSFLGFELREELGRGAFSRVFDATQPRINDRRLVVKVCVRGGDEINTLGGLVHDNIIPVYDAEHDPDSGLTAIWMPYKGRTTLYDLMDFAFGGKDLPTSGKVLFGAIDKTNYVPESGLDPGGSVEARRALDGKSYVEAVLGIAVQLADALTYTHGRGICHGDIKPSNVLLDREDGKAMLFDFNLAFSSRASDGRVGGTLPYMAPEQLRATIDIGKNNGDEVMLDARTDLYSLGVLLFELLSGQLPYGRLPKRKSRDELASFIYREQQHGLSRIQQLNSRVDGRFARIVERCLALDPADRPESAEALATELRRCEKNRAGRWLRLHRRKVIAAMGACAASFGLLAVGGGYYWTTLKSNFELGIDAIKQEQYDAAVRYFDGAVEAQPENIDAHFMLARAQLHSGRFDEALSRFRSLQGRFGGRNYQDDWRLAAFIAHCKSGAEGKLFLPHYQQALAQVPPNDDIARAALENDIAYWYIEQNEFEQARVHLERAAQYREVGQIQAFYHNLAIVERHDALVNQQEFDLSSIRTALQLGPASAELHCNAAASYALAACLNDSDQKEFLTEALEHCERAVSKGLPGKQLEAAGSVCRALKANPDFQRFLTADPSRNLSALSTRVAAPLMKPDDLLTQ